MTVQAGLTALFTASVNGHLDVVRLLLENKADANLTESQADQVPEVERVYVCACVCLCVRAMCAREGLQAQ